MRTIELDITLDDIEHGVPKECAKCPIARALRRALPEAVYLEVDTSCIYFHEPPNRRWFTRTPAEAVTFIDRFDGGQFVESFHLTLEFRETICSNLSEWKPENNT